MVCRSGRSPEICGPEQSISPGPPSRRSAATKRCARTSSTGSPRSEVAERFDYSPANVHQMASELRAGRAVFFRDIKPGPKGHARPSRVRDRVLALRAQDRSVDRDRRRADTRGNAGVSANGLDDPARRRDRAPPRRTPPPGAPPRLDGDQGPCAERVAGRHDGRAATTPACSCWSPRSSSSDSRHSSPHAATRQRRSSRHGTRSGRCCCTSAAADPSRQRHVHALG